VTRGDPGDASAREPDSSSSAKLAPESGGHSQEKPLHLLKISPEAHESMAVDAANYLCYQLQNLLAPVSFVIDQRGPWEERSAMVRLTQKLQKSKRKHVAELYQKVHPYCSFYFICEDCPSNHPKVHLWMTLRHFTGA
jgi:hypothetical protein